MRNEADIIRSETAIKSETSENHRKAALYQRLMAEGIAQLIRHRLSTAPRSVPGSACPALLLITQLRQSGMGELEHVPGTGLTLSMHGTTAVAPTARGVLWEWSTAALKTKEALT